MSLDDRQSRDPFLPKHNSDIDFDNYDPNPDADKDEMLLFGKLRPWRVPGRSWRPLLRIFGFAACLCILIVLGAGFFYGGLPYEPFEVGTFGSRVSGKNFNHTSGKRKAVIMASYKKQNLSWARDVPSDWEMFRYLHDDRHAPYHTPSKQGNEANAYLTYIIDHYDDLPDYNVFIHGHDRGWHQPEHTADKIRALNLTALDEWGYFSLRCTHMPGCTPDTVIHIAEHNDADDRWMQDFLPFFIKYFYPGIPTPDYLSSQCCAQFAATREQIRLRTRAWYEEYRQPLLEDLSYWSTEVWKAPVKLDGYLAGVAYEKVLPLMFGKGPNYCPDEELCENVFFSGKIKCDGKSGRFPSKGWEKINCTANFDD